MLGFFARLKLEMAPQSVAFTLSIGMLVVIVTTPTPATASAAPVAPTPIEEQEALRPTDDQLEQLVKQALSEDPIVESFEIVVTAAEGSLRLNGTVDSNDERGRAGAVAAEIDGVIEVENRITVERSPVPSHRPDVEIQRDIVLHTEALSRTSIEVRVEDGFATLVGVVPSADARRTLTEMAFCAGAVLVKNEVRIDHRRAPLQ